MVYGLVYDGYGQHVPPRPLEMPYTSLTKDWLCEFVNLMNGAVLTVLSVKSVGVGCGWLVRGLSSPFLIVTSIEVMA